VSPLSPGLPPGRRRGVRHTPREGRQAPPHRAPFRRGRDDRGVHRQGAAFERDALSRPAQLAQPKLGQAPIGAVTMYNLVQGYLARLPASLREEEVTDKDGTVKKVKRCIYTPHSLRPTTATLLLDAGVDIIKGKHAPCRWWRWSRTGSGSCCGARCRVRVGRYSRRWGWPSRRQSNKSRRPP
jgi:hypothetical protein